MVGTCGSAGERLSEVTASARSVPLSMCGFDDGTFDLVVSFTGLHCFPRPVAAVSEIARVLRPGGVLSGSAFLNDTGLQYEPMRLIGRAGGLLGPAGSRVQLAHWLDRAGFVGADIRTSGAMVYFRAERGAGTSG